MVPWDRIAQVEVDSGFVAVRQFKDGKVRGLAAEKAADVPNLGTFLTFAARLRQG